MKHSLELINSNFENYKLCTNCQSINLHSNIECNYCNELLIDINVMTKEDINDYIDIEMNYCLSKNEIISLPELWKIEINV